LTGSAKLAEMDSVAAKGVKLGDKPLKENQALQPTKVIQLGTNLNRVSEGNW
jgi:hypothetical protein